MSVSAAHVQARPKLGLVDADVHIAVPTPDQLTPYLTAHWVEQLHETGFNGAPQRVYVDSVPTSLNPDYVQEAGNQGLGLDNLRQQVFDRWGADYGIANCSYAVDSISNPDAAAALATAANEWIYHEYLQQEPRLRGTIVVPSHMPDLAAAEIRRVGARPEFVQVQLPVRSAVPYGRRDRHEIFAAAVEHDLVVSLQYGGFPGTPTTGAGWPSYFIEDHVGVAAVAQSQVISLVTEGVFDLFPSLRVSVVECGFTWLPSLMWRFDKDWKGLRREVPWLRLAPSEVISEHMRFTTQPLDLPDNDARALAELADQIDVENLLMFASDYPHWHRDAAPESFPGKELDDSLRNKILSENARLQYRLS